MVRSLTESLPGAAASGPAEEAEKAISFLGALRIPGVVEFSLCLFSTKLVSYVFLFWLPHYIQVSHSNFRHGISSQLLYFVLNGSVLQQPPLLGLPGGCGC